MKDKLKTGFGILIVLGVSGCSSIPVKETVTKTTRVLRQTPVLVFGKLQNPFKKQEPDVNVKQITLAGIKHYEGFYSRPYYCKGGALTIGYGFTGKYFQRRISRQKADSLLEGKVWADHEAIVKKNVKVPLNKYQLCALVSFTYNTGEGSLQKLVNGPGRLNSGNYNSVPTLLLRYCKAKGKVLKGLQKRRIWEAALFQGKIQSYGN